MSEASKEAVYIVQWLRSETFDGQSVDAKVAEKIDSLMVPRGQELTEDECDRVLARVDLRTQQFLDGLGIAKSDVSEDIYDGIHVRIEREIKKLRAENERLRQELRFAMTTGDVIWRNGERWVRNDADTDYVRLLDLAPNLERMWILEHAAEVEKHKGSPS